jgi:uncharacterized protein YlzI (FlbEa/FlbD family)
MLSIRTQDRTALVPYDKTINIISDNAKVVYEQNEDYTIALSNKRIIVCGKRVLGRYTTQERALEVLDKIQQFMDNIGIANSSIAKEISSVIYEMPKE